MRKLFLAIVLLAAPLQAQSGSQRRLQPVFRGAATSVLVPVSNRDMTDNRAIGMLKTAEDRPSSTPLPPSLTFSLTGMDPRTLQTASRSFPGFSVGLHNGTTRYAAHVGMVFDGSGVAAGPASADYGLGVTAYKNDWPTSAIPGEGNGITIIGRNGVGDFAGMLCNVGTRQGFSACSEGVSSIFEPGGGLARVATRAIIASAFHNGDSYGGNGAVLYAEVGTGTAALDITAKPGAAWSDALQVRAADAAPINFRVTGDGLLEELGANADTRDVALRLGAKRTGSAPAYIDLSGSPADATSGSGFGLRIMQKNDASYLISRTNRLTLNMIDGSGSVALQVAGVSRLLATATGLGFNGRVPISPPTLAAALPTDGSATNAQIVAAYNTLRAALITYGLAQ